MSTVQERKLARRNALLDALSAAEAEWGEKLEVALTNEASFLKKVMDSRTGAGSATGRVQDRLSDLTVDKIEEFLTG